MFAGFRVGLPAFVKRLRSSPYAGCDGWMSCLSSLLLFTEMEAVSSRKKKFEDERVRRNWSSAVVRCSRSSRSWCHHRHSRPCFSGESRSTSLPGRADPLHGIPARGFYASAHCFAEFAVRLTRGPGQVLPHPLSRNPDCGRTGKRGYACFSCLSFSGLGSIHCGIQHRVAVSRWSYAALPDRLRVEVRPLRAVLR
jgi:hypothetical protein